MQLAERHIINKSHLFYNELDSIGFFSKNLYNKANYIIRQEFINTSKEKELGKRDKPNWIRYHQIQKQLQNDKDFDYGNLQTHKDKPILKEKSSEYNFDWLITRSNDQSLNRIWVYDQKQS